MAHEACSKKCVKSASPCYSSVLFGFFPLVSNDGGATSTPVSQKLEGNSPPKAGSEQKCLVSKDLLHKTLRWCPGRHEHPYSPKDCLVMLCCYAYTWTFLGRKPTDRCQILQEPSPKMFGND